MRQFVAAITVAVATLALNSCTVDCQVCSEAEGVKECSTAKDVKRSECSDCTDDVIIESTKSDEEGELSKEELAMAKEAGYTYTCEKK